MINNLIHILKKNSDNVENNKFDNKKFDLVLFFKTIFKKNIDNLFECLNKREDLKFYFKKNNTLFIKTTNYFRIKNNSLDFIVYFKEYEFLHNINNKKDAIKLIELIEYSLKNFF